MNAFYKEPCNPELSPEAIRPEVAGKGLRLMLPPAVSDTGGTRICLKAARAHAASEVCAGPASAISRQPLASLLQGRDALNESVPGVRSDYKD